MPLDRQNFLLDSPSFRWPISKTVSDIVGKVGKTENVCGAEYSRPKNHLLNTRRTLRGIQSSL